MKVLSEKDRECWHAESQVVGQVSRKVGRRVVSESEKSWVAGCEEALSEKDKSAGRQRGGWLATQSLSGCKWAT